MPVYERTEYYVSMTFETAPDGGQKERIKDFLSERGLSDYEFEDDDLTLVIDGFDEDDKADAEEVEEEINALL